MENFIVNTTLIPSSSSDPPQIQESPSSHSVSSLLDVLHQTTLVFLEEMMTQLDRWTYEKRFHSYRVSILSEELGKRMGLSPSRLTILRGGALLHDIGKIRIQQDILNKPGALTPNEWSIMRQHPAHGRSILSQIPSLAFAKDIVYQHHERWNGTGYPKGLKQDAIQMESRIFGVVDSYDAMISRRSYNIVKSHEEAIEEIQRNSGILFDPEVVHAFENISREFFDQVEFGRSHPRFIQEFFVPEEYLALLVPLGQSVAEKKGISS
ncbi:HD-GYP domain-containing protein [Leptospirillum ferrooxidans]|uniref:Putative metal dependent phosphohydrolase n=1 Tax=Leptospirillum ferrooxidans (strain C2-3) TaxID=1162668 RepID=I0IM09_LEPFC|nr:HD-GYP domain-containing protein [Leptospirillum ferrooxidans]BAM06308.1 putative metal dependent phosphohydrolase [Leptospirillum ferrooxidans C2-3]